MNTGEDEPSSGLNGRLRPRKSNVPSLQTNKAIRKSDGKSVQDKTKKTNTSPKASLNKPDEPADKSDSSPTPQFWCPYCDRKFASKQTLSKHGRRLHFSNSKQSSFIDCLFCNHAEADCNDIIRHMVDSHPNQYFACLECHTRFPSTFELAEHKLNICEKQKISYRSKLRQKESSRKLKKTQKSLNSDGKIDDDKDFTTEHGFNGIVISCELKPSQVHDGADIENNITTNLILPSSKNLGNNTIIEKNAVIVLDDIQWNKRIPPNFSFHNTDADQILSRLGVVHRSPRTGESTRKEWFKNLDDSTQKFEKCFDTTFYSKVASNVQENLTKFLDGSFNFSPDPDNTIKTRKAKNSVVINTAEGFPILLAFEQYSRNMFDGYMPRAIAPKHKWKWDNLENDRNTLNPDQIKRDSHTNNCIITLVSSLDIWTQLCMRKKYEEKFSNLTLEKRVEKQNIISKELKEILESREIPTSSSSQVVKFTSKPTPINEGLDFPASLGLVPSTPNYDVKPAVLSGEWVRPRCYVCCACGTQTRDSRALSSHISTQHPNAHVQHYEIVGELLLNADILKHLYVPPSQMYNRTRPLRGFRECTKCKKSITLEDLHQHMLDCAGDTPTVRRKCRYRPFGVRRRRPRLPDNTIRKKIRKEIRNRQSRQKTHMRPRPKIRTEVGDAETIRKMLADLPAKRHRVMVNPMNPMLRPRKKLDQQRTKLMMKRRSSDDPKNRKRGNKGINNVSQGESAGNDGQSKTQITDDDNQEEKKTFKSKMIHATGRGSGQSEPLKRKSILNRPKRKTVLVKDQETLSENINNPLNPDVCSSSVQTEELSTENSPERIDVNAGPYNTREHANRGGSNNRDGQRPGCSEQNRNSQNSCAPTQNVPLKHSIARLTADSETHDKSVQFHHLFLVQQKCNNTIQHMPTGQQLLFENEAAVTKLDKPPLHFNQRGPLDSFTFQKSKLNKPRKGLNDCIAMLKNKLVDPVPTAPTGHISVQCGGDDPLYPDPVITRHREVNVETKFEDIQTPAQVFSRRSSTQERSLEIQLENGVVSKKSGAYFRRKSNQEQPQPLDVLPVSSLIEHKSPVTHSETVLVTDKPEDVYLKGESSTPRKTNSNNEHELKQKSKIEIISHKSLPPLSQSQQTKTQGRRDPVQCNTKHDLIKQHSKEMKHVRRETHQKANEVHVECKLVRRNSLEVMHSPKLSRQIETVVQPKSNVIEVKPTETFNRCDLSKQKQTNVFIESNLSKIKSSNILSDCDLTSRIQTELYSENDFHQVPTDIPPAHASTNVESILAAPLDLSGKIISTDSSQKTPNQDNVFLSSYDTYETLDLSNKSLDKIRSMELCIMTDDVVDLRIKTLCESNTVDLCAKATKIDNATDLSLKKHVDACIPHDLSIPTDLSVRGKDKNVPNDLPEQRHENINFVHDLSDKKSKMSENKPKTKVVDKEAATDLTNKGSKVAPITPTNVPVIEIKEDDNNDVLTDVTKTVIELSDSNVPADLSRKGDNEKQNNISIETNTKTTEQVPEVPKNSIEINKIQEKAIPQSPNSQIQKPIYDPTLKIPQYKLRTTTTTTPSESVIDAVVSTPQTNELPSPENVPVTNFPVSVTELQSSTTTNAPISAPIATHERLNYPFNTTLSAGISSNFTGSIPVYTLPNRIIAAHGGKIESTTPVYTLANICISVTKIGTPCSTTLTSSLLSVPGTTIANTTSVYTLAGTTIGAPITYGGIPGTHVMSPTINNFLTATSLAVSEPTLRVENHSTTYDIDKTGTTATVEVDVVKNKITNNTSITADQDPETARKIAMLPKELVEILGTMPVDHRNQLLNILPQYVSTSTATPVSQCETTHTLTSLSCLSSYEAAHKQTTEIDNKTTPEFISDFSIKDTSPPQSLFPPPNKSVTTVHLVDPLDTDKKQSISFLLPPPPPPPLPPSIKHNINSEDIKTSPLQTVPASKGECSSELLSVDTDTFLIDPFTGAITKRPPKDNDCDNQDKIIDLTEDESVPPSKDIMKDVENLTRSITIPPQEIQDFSCIIKINKQKISNDQTASLRAVRIKAPSERHKSISLESQSLKISVEKQTTLITNDLDENETNKTLLANTFLAIQQAEVSSTQHNNRNSVVDSKFPLAISPNSNETQTEHWKNVSRRLSTPSDEIVAKKDNEQQSQALSLIKSGLVTSSISTKINKAKVKEKERKNTDSDDVQNTSSNFTIASSPSGSKIDILKNLSEQNVLDLTGGNLSELPIQSSTPNPKSENENKENTSNMSLTRKDKIPICDDEDSEDDVSLAIIVKQKQANQHKMMSCDKDVSKNMQINVNSVKDKKRKKDKKSKKDEKTTIVQEVSFDKKSVNDNIKPIRNDLILTEVALTSHTESKPDDQETRKHIENIEESTTENLTSIITVQENHSEMKQNNSVNNENIEPHNIEHTTVHYEYVINKENDNNSSDISKQEKCNDNGVVIDVMATNLSEHDFSKCVTLEKNDNKDKNKEISNNMFTGNMSITRDDTTTPNEKEKHEEVTIENTKGNENLKQKERSKKKKKHECKMIEVEENNYSNISEEEKLNISQEIGDKKIDIQTTTDKTSVSTLDPYSTVETNDTQDSIKSQLESTPGENQLSNNFEYAKSKKTVRIKKPKNAGPANVNVVTTELLGCPNVEKDITPLRRSRRGKSLFMDRSSIEYENMINSDAPDTALEHKTPLTKKQLIFSKLLLDEENNTKPSERSIIMEQGSSFKDDNNISQNVTDIPSICASQVSDVETIHETFVEKNKSMKRKKSPQLKRKTKKKKSIDNTQSRESDTNKLPSYSVDLDSIPLPPENVAENECYNLPDSKAHQKEKSDFLNKTTSNGIEEANTLVTDSDNGNYTVPKNGSAYVNCSKLISSTEKRKINNLTSNVDNCHSSKPKRSKMYNKNKYSFTSDEDDNDKISDCKVSETRAITCYSKPIAARRTRSKSVVVKSSNASDLYDPYDIELDDMIEKTEPFALRGTTSGNANNNYKLSKEINSKKIQKIKPAISIETDITELSETLDANISDTEDDGDINNAKDDLSDSDESSKSDVPLKKYVEEKEKKISELDDSISVLEKEMDDGTEIDQSDKQNVKDSKKSRRTLAVCNNVDSVTIQNETDEQLRSEQFMESFGFFSERKPRKSNLLATKKISETFHSIANESDDIYFGFKDKTTKRSLQNENRKSAESESNPRTPQHSPTKKTNIKRGRKRKCTTKTTPCYCHICKRKFRRPDNYLRHQMTLLHISKLSEIEMKIKTAPVYEEPNYLIAYKQQLDRLKILRDQMKQKRNSKSAPKITLPTLEEILASVNKTVREQQLRRRKQRRRGLSHDEALFLHCCKLLKESYKNDVANTETTALASDVNAFPSQSSVSGLGVVEKTISDDKCDKSDGDVDSITAKNILESEEVRNLENDLISGLKEAANASNHNKNTFEYQHTLNDTTTLSQTAEVNEELSSPNITESHYEQMEESFEVVVDTNTNKIKKHSEVKDKMYPDVFENIDMFEDKFDKIKRKCRSQAAAAKQLQPVIEPRVSHKGRKKSDKKKGKKNSKKSHQNTVLTKGALKGFDGIRVSIPTSDINMSAIVPPVESLQKKRKKNSSKKKRNKRDSESSSKHDSDHRAKDNSTPQKKVDVYEFMDNEDAELFEFRPSTLMERFKSMCNKEVPSTSKVAPVADEAENSSASASDGDDFVYMSDDYVCSDDETENSLMSCEMGNGKVGVDVKKSISPLKRKDVVEKNAVMGKIFKNNAVRSEKKNVKVKEPVKPKANLDQLFDSLLEDEPNSSMLNDDTVSPQKDTFTSPKKYNTPSPKKNDLPPSKYEQLSVKTYDYASTSKNDFSPPKKHGTPSPKKNDGTKSSALSKRYNATSPDDYRLLSPKKYDSTPLKKYDTSPPVDYGPSTSKGLDIASSIIDYGPSTSKKYDLTLLKEYKTTSPKIDSTLSKKYDVKTSKVFTATSPKYSDCSHSKKYDLTSPEKEDISFTNNDLKDRSSKDKSPVRKLEEYPSTSYDYNYDLFDQASTSDDTGVARQRARRKCTVGKQNVLAETWSSESEPDGGPPRPNSAESVMSSVGRKKKGRKKDGQQSGGRRSNSRHVAFKKQDIESRVTSSNRNTSSSSASGSGAGGSRTGSSGTGMSGAEGSDVGGSENVASLCAPLATVMPGPSGLPGPPGPPGTKGRSRSLISYWPSEGDEEQEHLQQQHGWIVGDSHKKLVTMLAHAKGRKRNNDDKRHLVE